MSSGTAQKYSSSYERVAKSIQDFVSGDQLMAAREQFFAHLSLRVGTISAIFNRVAEAVSETRNLLSGYIREHSEFQEIGGRMMVEWDEGMRALSK